MQTEQLATQLTNSRGRQIKFTPERLQQIRNLVERGRSREEIAELIGATVGSLQVTCSRLGISLRLSKEMGLLRRGGPHNGTSTYTASRRGGVPPINGQPQQNSQSGPVEQPQATTPHEERARSSGDLLPPSPPAEKATAREDQARKASTGDGAGDSGCGRNCEAALGKTTDARTVVPRFRYGYFRGPGHEAS